MSAAFVNKFMGLLGIKETEPEDEEIEDVMNTDEENEIEDNDKVENAYKSYRARRNNFSNVDDEYLTNNRTQAKVIPMSSAVTTNSKMVITQPSCFDDVVEVCDYMKGKKSVIVSLEAISNEEGRRILDFLFGATYSIEGNMQKISKLIYLITPKNIEIQNDVERENYKSKLSFSWIK